MRRFAWLALIFVALAVSSPSPMEGREGSKKKVKGPQKWHKTGWRKGFTRQFKRWGKTIAPLVEIDPQKSAPTWVGKLPAKPIFSFVQLADIHFWYRDTRLLETARKFAQKNLHPDFTVLTGDNVNGPDREAQQVFLQKYFARKWGKTLAIRGDNDPVGFEPAWGTTNWAYTYGGVKLVGFGMDVDMDWVGLGSFEHLGWLKKAVSTKKPTIVFFHQPLFPPSFLNAAEVLQVLRRPNVLVITVGHLHYDYEVSIDHILHVMAPSITLHRRHGFKHFLVYPNRIVVKTYEFVRGKYQFANKWQSVAIPRSMKPVGKKVFTDVGSLPPQPMKLARNPQEMLEIIAKIRLVKARRFLMGQSNDGPLFTTSSEKKGR